MNLRVILLLTACVLVDGCGGRIRQDPETDAATDTPAAASSNAGTTSIAADPFHPGDDWTGTYMCAQGLTDVAVRIVAMHDDVIDDAVFVFDWTAGGVTGSYHMSGTFDPATSTATFMPGAWIDDPGTAGGYSWHSVGMTGTTNGNGYTGSITDSACGSFAVTRH